MKLKVHPEARMDLREGRAFYRYRSPLAAAAFTKEFQTALSRIFESPFRFAESEDGTRSFVFPWRFPYTIVYVVREKLIVVLAIAHQSKDPGYWRHRM